MKRKFTKTEERITKKNVEMLNEELEYEYVILQQKQHAVESAPIIVKKQIKELNQQIKVILQKINEMESIIEISTKQLKEGIEIKEIKEVKTNKK